MKKTVETESRRGKLHALDLQAMLKNNDPVVNAEFIEAYRGMGIAHKRRLCRFMIQLAHGMKPDKITTENDDIAAFLTHLIMICEPLLDDD